MGLLQFYNFHNESIAKKPLKEFNGETWGVDISILIVPYVQMGWPTDK